MLLLSSSVVFGIKLLRAGVCARSPVLDDTALGLLTPLPNAWAANNSLALSVSGQAEVLLCPGCKPKWPQFIAK